jgi:hypothetical protein
MNNSNTNANNTNEVSQTVEDFVVHSLNQERNEKYPAFSEERFRIIEEYNLHCIKNSKYSIEEVL